MLTKNTTSDSETIPSAKLLYFDWNDKVSNMLLKNGTVTVEEMLSIMLITTFTAKEPIAAITIFSVKEDMNKPMAINAEPISTIESTFPRITLQSGEDINVNASPSMI